MANLIERLQFVAVESIVAIRRNLQYQTRHSNENWYLQI